MLESATTLYEAERAFNKDKSITEPKFGVSFSGGGNRSAAFSIGVLWALYERALLDKVDIISAVSGGSYALSWYLLMPYYYREIVDPKARLDSIHKIMFDLKGGYQIYLENNAKPLGAYNPPSLLMYGAMNLIFDLILFNALRIVTMVLPKTGGDIGFADLLNAQSAMRNGYREGIQHSYQVLPDSKTGKALTGKALKIKRSIREMAYESAHILALSTVPPVTFPGMSRFASRLGLPSFVFNTTMHPPNPQAQVPLAHRIFELGSIGFGSDSSGYLTWEETEGLGYEPGMKPKKSWWRHKFQKSSPFATIRNFNIAPAISGAAVSSTNLDSKLLRWLLRLLNLGLEYRTPNPGNQRRLVHLSDGGHSENLGAYALLRRQCKTMLIVDAEYDPINAFVAYKKLKKYALSDLGVKLNIPEIDNGKFSEQKPVCQGDSIYQNRSQSKVYYLKLSMHPSLLGDHAETIKNYWEGHRKFPQESTVDQYFQDTQFKAYRALGYAIASTLPKTID